MKKAIVVMLMVATSAFVFNGCSEASKVAKDPMGYLSKHTWVLNSLMGKDIPTGLFGDRLPTLNFNPDGSLTGFSGCNNLTGGKLDLSKGLNLGQMAMTKMACPGEGEQSFMKALNDAGNVKVEPGLLTFLGKNGNELMKFVPQA